MCAHECACSCGFVHAVVCLCMSMSMCVCAAGDVHPCSKSAVVAHKFCTTIKNTKPTPINLLIADIFPSSSDAKIKVAWVWAVIWWCPPPPTHTHSFRRCSLCGHGATQCPARWHPLSL
jgi:hypothetical protein